MASRFFRTTVQNADLYISIDNIAFVAEEDEDEVTVLFATPLQYGAGESAGQIRRLGFRDEEADRFRRWFDDYR
jgi:hypothetical protein